MNSLAVFGLIFGGLAVTFAGLALFFDGYERGHRIGKERGYQDGFTAGKVRADQWWIDNEEQVEAMRQQIRKEAQ